MREGAEDALEMPLQQRRQFALEVHVENKWTFKVCIAETVYTICLRVANVITHSLNQQHHFSRGEFAEIIALSDDE